MKKQSHIIREYFRVTDGLKESQRECLRLKRELQIQERSFETMLRRREMIVGEMSESDKKEIETLLYGKGVN